MLVPTMRPPDVDEQEKKADDASGKNSGNDSGTAFTADGMSVQDSGLVLAAKLAKF